MSAEQSPVSQGETEAVARSSMVRVNWDRIFWFSSALVLVAWFVTSGLTRRLNYDEAIPLRAGWLLFEGESGGLPFCMPVTVLFGALAHAIEDPGTVFTIGRTLVLVSVLGILVAGARQAAAAVEGLAGVARQFAVLCTVLLLNAGFLTHAIEFRYDTVILVALFSSWALLSRKSPPYAVVGVLVVILGTHHMKGVVYAAAVWGLACLKIMLLDAKAAGAQPRTFAWPLARRLLGRLHAGIAITALSWIALTAALGFLDDALIVYRFFSEITVGVTKRWPWQSTNLTSAFFRDTAWWLLVPALAVLHVARERARPLAESWPVLSAGALALSGLAFLFIHPLPWAYLLALPAAFAGLLAAREIHLHWRARWAKAALGAALILGAVFQESYFPLSLRDSVRNSASAPRSVEVEALRELRARMKPDDIVVDPSGLAYFIKPAHPEWYADGIFWELIIEGSWMAGLDEIISQRCPWFVHTDRSMVFTEATTARLQERYVYSGRGVFLCRSDPRAGVPLQGPPMRLRNYW